MRLWKGLRCKSLVVLVAAPEAVAVVAAVLSWLSAHSLNVVLFKQSRDENFLNDDERCNSALFLLHRSTREPGCG